MSFRVLTPHRELFGNEEFSDCTVELLIAASHESDPSGLAPRSRASEHSGRGGSALAAGSKIGRTETAFDVRTLAVALAAASATESAGHRLVRVGEPLPAHRSVVCRSSPCFNRQNDECNEQQPSGQRPVFYVILAQADELPCALATVRFMYTGEVTGVPNNSLLRARRLSRELQVLGGVEACDDAIRDMIALASPRKGSVEALSGVILLYLDRELLPDPNGSDLDEGIPRAAMFDYCRQQLVGHSGSGRIKGPVPEGTPSLGDLLGWAFGDAPSVLSDPKTRRQMEQLSPAAIEALLRSSTFATDDESSVLLLLATWLQANKDTPEDVRKRLCRLLRLSQLSSVYLHVILPTLPWFPISTAEHRFLCLYAAATAEHRVRLVKQAAGSYDCSSPWYSAPARPSSMTSPRRYDWHTDQGKLRKKLLAANTREVRLEGTFSNGMTCVASLGFEWSPMVTYSKGSDKAGVILFAHLPSALLSSMPVSEQPTIPVPPGAARLAVKGRLPGGYSGEIWGFSYQKEYVGLSRGLGLVEALPVSQDAGGQWSGEADPLAAWSAYLQDGKVRGVLEWEAV